MIDPALLNTPQFSDPTLSEALGRDVVVKLENVSPIGSFKGRGADYFVGGLERLDERLVTATAGNWGIGLAYAGAAMASALTSSLTPRPAPASSPGCGPLGQT